MSLKLIWLFLALRLLRLKTGLSNFIPILFGDRETCTEMEVLQQNLEKPLSSQERESSSPQHACEIFASRQVEFSELVLDVAWTLKKPTSQQKLTSSHIQRLNCLLEYLMEKESSVILLGLYCSLRSAIDNNLVDTDSNSDARLLQKNMDTAHKRLALEQHKKDTSEMPALTENYCSHSSENDNTSVVTVTNQDLQRTVKNMLGLSWPSPSPVEDAAVPLLKDEVIMNVDLRSGKAKKVLQSFVVKNTLYFKASLNDSYGRLCLFRSMCSHRPPAKDRPDCLHHTQLSPQQLLMQVPFSSVNLPR